MAKILRLLIFIPLGITGFALAIANRQLVTVSFDPFNGGDIPGPSVTAPLFIVLLLALMVGAILGGVATWFEQGKHRRAVRNARAEILRLREKQDRSLV
ncbi:lipopolysaccharide assembly protein LapA domain-containing protein [Beijerinckia indica]|uniref:Lipopolysaccharide assembly protein A domain-containing protein n=1 Tax=Beijerinckia indica subsp. indica (strain ATCC 9039 / DSM 1715 / NCIMB 8712) TaxID=395963 RepID=B2IKV5_BEII9|nr:LapA family protein [Beijerinckia indica]ACB96495.1 conserved hypothetical protein [Beijerinckia indica subsp. indica ATCC 9039]